MIEITAIADLEHTKGFLSCSDGFIALFLSINLMLSVALQVISKSLHLPASSCLYIFFSFD